MRKKGGWVTSGFDVEDLDDDDVGAEEDDDDAVCEDFTCKDCGRKYDTAIQLTRHIKDSCSGHPAFRKDGRRNPHWKGPFPDAPPAHLIARGKIMRASKVPGPASGISLASSRGKSESVLSAVSVPSTPGAREEGVTGWMDIDGVKTLNSYAVDEATGRRVSRRERKMKKIDSSDEEEKPQHGYDKRYEE